MAALPIRLDADPHRALALTTEADVRTLLTLILWCLLFVLCWPLAILVLVLFPFVWLVLLPIGLAWVALDACLALLKAILLLPSRLLGLRSAK